MVTGSATPRPRKLPVSRAETALQPATQQAASSSGGRGRALWGQLERHLRPGGSASAGRLKMGGTFAFAFFFVVIARKAHGS